MPLLCRRWRSSPSPWRSSCGYRGCRGRPDCLPWSGLLLSGIAIGPHGLDVIGPHRPIADFFADLGKLLLMFCAGLEIDLALFRQGTEPGDRVRRPHHSATAAAGHRRRVSVRFPASGRGCLGISARIAHTAGGSDGSKARRNPPRADRGYVRRDCGVGHAVASCFRRCVSTFQTRLFRFRTGCATRRDRHLRPADSVWPEPAGSVFLKESGGCRGRLFRPDAAGNDDSGGSGRIDQSARYRRCVPCRTGGECSGSRPTGEGEVEILRRLPVHPESSSW